MFITYVIDLSTKNKMYRRVHIFTKIKLSKINLKLLTLDLLEEFFFNFSQ